MFEVIIILTAGVLAGIVTGTVGASATIVVAPLFIVLLDYHAYLAIGAALSIDVFSSSSSALIYYRNKRIKMKPALIILAFSLLGVIIGSYFSKYIPSQDMGTVTGLGITIAGLSIIFKKKRGAPKTKLAKKTDLLLSILSGTVIGLIGGSFGAGGGMMIFFVLILFLNYKPHHAVGTSVFIMIFIALTGAVAHYIYMPFPIETILLGGLGGVLGGVVSSKIANKVKEKTLKNIAGGAIFVLGILLFVYAIFS